MSTLKDCLTDILSCMESSKLKLTVETTDLIIIGEKQQRNKLVDYFPSKILDNDTPPSDPVRNLGVVFDNGVCFSQYISHVRKSYSV